MAASDQIRSEQQMSEARVAQGMALINRIFGGGSFGVGKTPTASAGTQYYDLLGHSIPKDYTPGFGGFSDWLQATSQGAQTGANIGRPMTGSTGKENQGVTLNNGRVLAPRVLQSPVDSQVAQQGVWNQFLSALAQNGGLYSGKQTTKGFDDAFYNAPKQAYEDFALPQLGQQYDQTNRQLSARVADQGIAGGSADLRLRSQLNRETDLQRLNIANQGLAVSNDLRQKVAQEKNNIVNQLISSSNPSLASQQALAATTNLSAPSPLPAVGNLFSNFASSYLTGAFGGGGQNNAFGYGSLKLPTTSNSGPVYGIGRG